MEGLSILKTFEEIHDKHREMKAISQQVKLKNDIKEIQKTQEEVVNIKNNLFNIFSFMIGLLGFIFINFNIFNDIGKMSVEKILVTVFMINSSFVTGIIILMSIQSLKLWALTKFT